MGDVGIVKFADITSTSESSDQTELLHTKKIVISRFVLLTFVDLNKTCHIITSQTGKSSTYLQ